MANFASFAFLRASLLSALALIALIAGFPAAAQVTRNASTFAELQAAVTASASAGDTISITNDIVVTSQVTLDKSITINGNGRILTVPVTGLDESGVPSPSPSSFRIFLVSGSGVQVVINDLTLRGGLPSGGATAAAGGGAIQTASGTRLTLRRSVIERGRSTWGGGGLASSGVTFLDRTRLSRNAARFGGGFNVAAGVMHIDRSVVAENRTELTNGGGGGGAVSNSVSALYVNNSTFANNQSTDIGGGLANSPGGTIHVLNSTFTGNVGYGATVSGGAIGSAGGTVRMANNIFAYNYVRSAGTVSNPTAFVLSDVTEFSPSTTQAHFNIFHATNAIDTTSNNVQYPGAADGSDNTLFSGGGLARITDSTGAEIGTAQVFRPPLVPTADGAGVTLDVGGFARDFANVPARRGTPTGYTGTPLPVVGYFNGSAWVNWVGTTASTVVVAVDQFGESRASPDIVRGSLSREIDNVFLLRVNRSTDGAVSGGSLYGDVYAAGAPVSLSALPNAGQRFVGWNCVEGCTGTASTDNPYSVAMPANNLALVPVFTAQAPGDFTVSYAGNGSTGGVPPASQTANAAVTIAGQGTLVRTGYTFNGWDTVATGGRSAFAQGASYGSSGAPNLTLFAQWLLIPPTVPGAPTIGAATAGNGQATVAFTAPASNGGVAITGYTVTSSPGGISASGASSPITVSGLTNGTTYTFTVSATNSLGAGGASAASNAVTPRAPQTITFGDPGTQNFGMALTLAASSTSGLPVTFSASTTGVCTVTASGVLTFVTAGTCTINADQAGDATFLPASQVSRSFTVSPVVPDAPTIGTATAGDTQASVAFTAPTNTGGALIMGYTLSVFPPDVAPVNGASSPIVVTGLTNGQAYTFTVTANNSVGPGPASAASNSITPRAIQTITFANPGAQSFSAPPTLSASSTSGLPVTFSSATTSACTITSGGALTFLALGTCTINADQAGDSAFLPAPTVSRSFAVGSSPPGAPTGAVATAGDESATLIFAAPASNGGASITGYTVTASPGGVTATGGASPITVAGLTNGVSYTFTVSATNGAGTGPASPASNSVTPRRTPVAPEARPDRAIAQVGAATIDIDVLANDVFAPGSDVGAVITIVRQPSAGTASVTITGAGQRISFTPPSTPGTVSLRYRVCTTPVLLCSEAELQVDVRPLAVTALQWTTEAERGFRDLPVSGLPALPGARFNAFGLVPPVVRNVLAIDRTDGPAPWSGGYQATTLRTLPAATGPATWRILVDATALNDVDLFLGVDRNANGLADPAELACAAAMSTSERCDIAIDVPAGQTVAYWALVRLPAAGDVARLALFETPTAGPLATRGSLVATGPGTVAAGGAFPLRLVWEEPTFLPGESRGGWVEMLADDGRSLGWVPVRLDRGIGLPTAFALASGVDHRIALGEGMAHERLFIDVPPGTARLEVLAQAGGVVSLYLARTPTPAPSSSPPTIDVAPPRDAATVGTPIPTLAQRFVVDSPAPGRWYVTPVNPPLASSVRMSVRATLVGTGPQLRPGGFFNPQRSGNGLFLYPAGSEWAGLWYTYLQDGTPTWYYLQAPAPGSTGIWRGTIYRSVWNGSSNALTPVGEATVTPRSTSAFTFSYTLDGETGSEAYESFGGGCPTVNGAPLNISGHWFDPLRSGTGYSVQLFPNYEFYLVFGYDAQGVPRYLVAERSGVGGSTETLTLEQLRGACPLCTRAGDPQRSPVGTLQRRVEGGRLRNITLSAAYVNGVSGTWVANDAVIPLGGLRGCAAN